MFFIKNLFALLSKELEYFIFSLKKSFDSFIFLLKLCDVLARQNTLFILPFYLYIMSTATFEKRDFDFSKY